MKIVDKKEDLKEFENIFDAVDASLGFEDEELFASEADFSDEPEIEIPNIFDEPTEEVEAIPVEDGEEVEIFFDDEEEIVVDAQTGYDDCITVQEPVEFYYEDKKIILEPGDKIRVLKEDIVMSWRDFVTQKIMLFQYFSEFYFETHDNGVDFKGLNAGYDIKRGSLKLYIDGNTKNVFTVNPEQNDIVTIYEDGPKGFKIQLKRLNATFYGFE